jgi:hypothetical protein
MLVDARSQMSRLDQKCPMQQPELLLSEDWRSAELDLRTWNGISEFEFGEARNGLSSIVVAKFLSNLSIIISGLFKD